LMLTLLASFATFEKKLIAERTSAALEYKKRNGKVYGHAPYGLSVDSYGKKLVPNEAEQKTLKYIIEWRGEG
jgi:DNA invertase Pin-like site-specific DNA recombinase